MDDHELTEDEVIATLVSLVVGGQETTMNLIGNGLLIALRHPEVMRRLRADPGSIPAAVEEFLRYESPTQFTARTVPEDRELHGHALRRGDSVIAVLGAANRDSTVFADPDRVEIGREPNRHLAFGWAAHFCPGAGMTRVLGRVAFEALLRRFPEVWAGPGAPQWQPNLALRGLDALPVTVRG